MGMTNERKQDICDAVSMLYEAKDKGYLNDDGSAPDSFVEDFIDLCEFKFKDGFIVGQEAFAEYDRSRFKKASFFMTKALIDSETPKKKHLWCGAVTASNGKTYMEVEKESANDTPEKFVVATSTKDCNFGKMIYKFVSNKKVII